MTVADLESPLVRSDNAMTIQQVVELTSLALTWPTILLGVAVVWFYSDSLLRKPKTATDWLLLGICAGFIGQTLDNFYWNWPWTASFLTHPWKDDLVRSGVYFNIFFRQMLGITAAVCHLKAASLSESMTKVVFLRIVGLAFLAGALYGLAMLTLYVGGFGE